MKYYIKLKMKMLGWWNI